MSLQLGKLALWRSPEYHTGEKNTYTCMKNNNKTTTNQSGKAVAAYNGLERILRLGFPGMGYSPSILTIQA